MIVNPSMLMPAISEQITVLLFALLLGIFLGVMYDFFRVMRVCVGVRYGNRTLKKFWDKQLPLIGAYAVGRGKNITDKIKNAVVCMGDILFSLAAGVAVSVFIYRHCYGIVRWYVFFGALLGFIAYYFTVGRVVLTVAELIMFFVATAVRYAVYFITRPIVMIFKKMKTSLPKRKDKKTENKAEEK